MKRIVLATTNTHKYEEIRNIMEGSHWQVIPAYSIENAPSVEEDGVTLEQNASKKAVVLSQVAELPAMADDTGLFVDALEGQPGVRSARYAGEDGNDAENVKKLLGSMVGIPHEARTAYFRTVVALVFDNEPTVFVDGVIKGWITQASRGNNGFGYDPIFQPQGGQKVFAEMSLEEKNAVSHRGIAFRNARLFLEKHS